MRGRKGSFFFLSAISFVCVDISSGRGQNFLNLPSKALQTGMCIAVDCSLTVCADALFDCGILSSSRVVPYDQNRSPSASGDQSPNMSADEAPVMSADEAPTKPHVGNRGNTKKKSKSNIPDFSKPPKKTSDNRGMEDVYTDYQDDDSKKNTSKAPPPSKSTKKNRQRPNRNILSKFVSGGSGMFSESINGQNSGSFGSTGGSSAIYGGSSGSFGSNGGSSMIYGTNTNGGSSGSFGTNGGSSSTTFGQATTDLSHLNGLFPPTMNMMIFTAKFVAAGVCLIVKGGECKTCVMSCGYQYNGNGGLPEGVVNMMGDEKPTKQTNLPFQVNKDL